MLSQRYQSGPEREKWHNKNTISSDIREQLGIFNTNDKLM